MDEVCTQHVFNFTSESSEQIMRLSVNIFRWVFKPHVTEETNIITLLLITFQGNNVVIKKPLSVTIPPKKFRHFRCDVKSSVDFITAEKTLSIATCVCSLIWYYKVKESTCIQECILFSSSASVYRHVKRSSRSKYNATYQDCVLELKQM